MARCLLREFGITSFGFVRGLLDAVTDVQPREEQLARLIELRAASVVYCPDEAVGERIVAKFAEELEKRIPQQAEGFGISVGVAGMKELNLVGHDELIKGADQALYEAKDAGKNCIHLAQTLA